MIDFRNLETFVWVARLRKFHLAAEKLNTTQPAISARIALLERDLGVRLFDRRPRRAELTAAGFELLSHAERMLALRTEILHAFKDPAALRGVLRLGVPETIVHTWLTTLVERISRDYPGVTLDIEIDSTPNLRRALMTEKLDIAFLHQPGIDEGIKCEPLCSYPLGWFASGELELPPARIGIADLAVWPIITFRRNSPPYIAVVQLLAREGQTQARIFGSSAIAAIVRMTLDRIGVCVLPQAVVQHELHANTLRALDVECALPALDFYVCYRQETDNPLPSYAANLAIHMARRYLDPHSDPSKLSIGEIQKED